jgi:hypothetical protein
MKKIVFLIAFIGLSFAVTSQQTITATITHDALQREYILYVPANYTGIFMVMEVMQRSKCGTEIFGQLQIQLISLLCTPTEC